MSGTVPMCENEFGASRSISYIGCHIASRSSWPVNTRRRYLSTICFVIRFKREPGEEKRKNVGLLVKHGTDYIYHDGRIHNVDAVRSRERERE